MKWIDHGQIFETAGYGLDYAKSPQALVLDDRVRVYFSACRPDGGKLISYACFADFDKGFQKVMRVSDRVLGDGGLGCFDEHGVFPFSPVRVGNEIYAYTGGWSRRVSVSVETGIGLAVSADGGETFRRFGNGPVLTGSLNEPFLVIDGFVRRYEGLFHMWYIRGTDWLKFAEDEAPDRVYKIARATSEDGICWKKYGGGT